MPTTSFQNSVKLIFKLHVLFLNEAQYRLTKIEYFVKILSTKRVYKESTGVNGILFSHVLGNKDEGMRQTYYYR